MSNTTIHPYGQTIMKNKIRVIPEMTVEIIGYLYTTCTIDRERFREKILNGTVELEKTGDIDYLLLDANFRIEQVAINRDLLNGNINLPRNVYNTVLLGGKIDFDKDLLDKNNLLDGKIGYERATTADLGVDNLLSGKLEIEKETQKDNILRGNGYIDIEDMQYDILNGKFDLEYSDLQTGLDSSLELVKSPYFRTLNFGNFEFEQEDYEKRVLRGYATIDADYHSTEFTGKVKIPMRVGIKTIFGRVKVLTDYDYDFRGVVGVYTPFTVDTPILKGSLTIEKESFLNDIIAIGNIKDIIPRIDITLDGVVELSSVYTRKDYMGKLDIVLDSSTDFNCSIEVTPEVKRYEKNMLYGTAYTGELYNRFVYGTVEVRQHIDQSELTKPIATRIVIAVSPTWHYDAKVFQDTIVTFFNRYYGKRDFHILYGGNPRSDFDLETYAAAFKIPKDRLHKVPIIMTPNNFDSSRRSVYNFIAHMESFPIQNHMISRVFLFMNQPAYYRNDPMAPVAGYCKKNNISCVCVSSGGEYQEITDYDKRRDALQNYIEFDRQNFRYVVEPVLTKQNNHELNADQVTY